MPLQFSYRGVHRDGQYYDTSALGIVSFVDASIDKLKFRSRPSSRKDKPKPETTTIYNRAVPPSPPPPTPPLKDTPPTPPLKDMPPTPAPKDSVCNKPSVVLSPPSSANTGPVTSNELQPTPIRRRNSIPDGSSMHQTVASQYKPFRPPIASSYYGSDAGDLAGENGYSPLDSRGCSPKSGAGAGGSLDGHTEILGVSNSLDISSIRHSYVSTYKPYQPPIPSSYCESEAGEIVEGSEPGRSDSFRHVPFSRNSSIRRSCGSKYAPYRPPMTRSHSGTYLGKSVPEEGDETDGTDIPPAHQSHSRPPIPSSSDGNESGDTIPDIVTRQYSIRRTGTLSRRPSVSRNRRTGTSPARRSLFRPPVPSSIYDCDLNDPNSRDASPNLIGGHHNPVARQPHFRPLVPSSFYGSDIGDGFGSRLGSVYSIDEHPESGYFSNRHSYSADSSFRVGRRDSTFSVQDNDTDDPFHFKARLSDDKIRAASVFYSHSRKQSQVSDLGILPEVRDKGKTTDAKATNEPAKSDEATTEEQAKEVKLTGVKVAQVKITRTKTPEQATSEETTTAALRRSGAVRRRPGHRKTKSEPARATSLQKMMRCDKPATDVALDANKALI